MHSDTLTHRCAHTPSAPLLTLGYHSSPCTSPCPSQTSPVRAVPGTPRAAFTSWRCGAAPEPAAPSDPAAPLAPRDPPGCHRIPQLPGITPDPSAARDFPAPQIPLDPPSSPESPSSPDPPSSLGSLSSLESPSSPEFPQPRRSPQPPRSPSSPESPQLPSLSPHVSPLSAGALAGVRGRARCPL